MAQQLSEEFIDEAISLTESMTDGVDGWTDATLPMEAALRLRRSVGLMARVIRTEHERSHATVTLDDAVRYMLALWPRGDTLVFHAGDETTQPSVRWRQFDWSGETVEVSRVENEAPSQTLARIVVRLRELAVAECDAAEARVTALRNAIASES